MQWNTEFSGTDLQIVLNGQNNKVGKSRVILSFWLHKFPTSNSEFFNYIIRFFTKLKDNVLNVSISQIFSQSKN